VNASYRTIMEYHHDPEPLRLIMELASTLKLTKATKSGRPEEFVVLPYAAKFFDELLGWKRPDGTRRYRRALWSMARKNGKTIYLALLALVLLIFDTEAEPEIVVVAGDFKQAGLVFQAVRSLIESNLELSQLLEITPYSQTVRNPTNGGTLRSISSEGHTKHGLNPSTVIVDEYHALSSEHEELISAMATASGARRQPLFISISTAGSNPLSLYGREYDRAKKVLAGTVDDPTYLSHVYELPDGADWRDEENWHLANPALDIIIDRQQLREMRDAALRSPHLENDFRRFFCNQWTQATSTWIPAHVLNKNDGPVIEEELRGVPCYGGLDLSQKNDLTCFTLIWEKNGLIYVRPWFYAPEEGIVEKGHHDGVDYKAWQEQGYIELIPGPTVSAVFVRERILQICSRFDVKQIAFDRYNSDEVVGYLTERGLNLVEFSQGYGAMNAPAKKIETTALEGGFRFGFNPILAWNFASSTISTDVYGNYKIVKPDRFKSSKRVDGVLALAMAIGAWQRKPDDEFRSIYEDPLTACM
jgi:phage terminase large subunit-like protein